MHSDVLILVLMEYALEVAHSVPPCVRNSPSLNPCFNGICSRRQFNEKDVINVFTEVLILVLMEYALEANIERIEVTNTPVS